MGLLECLNIYKSILFAYHYEINSSGFFFTAQKDNFKIETGLQQKKSI